MKSIAQMHQLARIIQTEVDNLPETSAFGDSNCAAIRKGTNHVLDLRNVISGFPSLEEEVTLWINDEPSVLVDYLL